MYLSFANEKFYIKAGQFNEEQRKGKEPAKGYEVPHPAPPGSWGRGFCIPRFLATKLETSTKDKTAQGK